MSLCAVLLFKLRQQDSLSISIWKRKGKEKFTLFSEHNGSLPRRQPEAMTTGHSTKGKEKIKNLRPILSGIACLLPL